MEYTVAIVGGGAGGMAAAITAAKLQHKVLLMERNDVVGKKILATGNGKCNFSNRNMKTDCFYTDDYKKLEKVLKEYTTDKVCDFFEDAGILYREKNGYLYPYSEQASCVREMLYKRMLDLGVTVVTGEKIENIVKNKKGFVIQGAKEKYFASKLILACGGMASPKTGSDGNGYELARKLGHKIAPTFPSLVQLICSEKYCKKLSGIRATARVWYDGEQGVKEVHTRELGEVQLTDYGISGIPVFQLSGYINQLLVKRKKVKVYMDFLPEISEDEVWKIAEYRKKNFKDRSLKEAMNGVVNHKLLEIAMELKSRSGNEKVSTLKKQDLAEILLLLKEFSFTVTESKTYEQAQVTRGGVYLSDVDENMQSLHTRDLYFCGELLNVDGICGGYNLHFAWSSGMIAGQLKG